MHVLRRVPLWGVLILLIYMPLHVFLAQSLSLATGGLEVWKIAKDVLLAILILFTICLVWQQREATKLFNWLVGLGVAYLLLHLILWAVHPDMYFKTAILGTIYNVRLPSFVVLGYGASLLIKHKFAFSSILRIILGISTVVALLGVLQYFLPKDLLTHLGYSLDRGARPAFFIDDNPALPRIMSTLREPNALGAYLLLPFTALSLFAFRVHEHRRRLLLWGMWALHGLALFLTFSRSAWLGVMLAVLLAVWWQYRPLFVRVIKRGWPAAIALAFLFVVVFAQYSNNLIKSYITHATPEATEDLDSNDYHWLLVRRGVEGVVSRPSGHGPGTAGIVSIQNPSGGVLTENYYVQIAYEVGLLGLGLFIAISVVLYIELRKRRNVAGTILLASFWGYVVTNMLLHTWSNEAVASQWWLLAGLVLASSSEQVTRMKVARQ